jgi:sortase A
LLLIGGVGIIIFTFAPVAGQEIRYEMQQVSGKEPVVADVSPETDEAVAPTAQPWEYQRTIIYPRSLDFSLVIPEIGVNSLVFPNIDSGNEAEYLPILKQGVAHAAGSSLPNQPGVVFLFSHSTDAFYNIGRYNAAFFLLNKLKPADEIYLFYRNRRYQYAVTEKRIVAAEEIPDLVAGLSGNQLVLQTCWPPGTTLKRLLVLATPN